MARAAALENSSEMGDMKETLQTLVDTASEFLKSLPKVRKPGTSLQALRDAIAEAEQVLAVDSRSKSRTKG